MQGVSTLTKEYLGMDRHLRYGSLMFDVVHLKVVTTEKHSNQSAHLIQGFFLQQ